MLGTIVFGVSCVFVGYVLAIVLVTRAMRSELKELKARPDARLAAAKKAEELLLGAKDPYRAYIRSAAESPAVFREERESISKGETLHAFNRHGRCPLCGGLRFGEKLCYGCGRCEGLAHLHVDCPCGHKYITQTAKLKAVG